MQIKINGQTISLAAPEPFLSILRRENPDNGGEFTYNDGRQAVFQRG